MDNVLANGVVGTTEESPANEAVMALDRYRNLKVLPAGGQLADAAMQGRLFSIASQAVVATTAALAKTWTGLGISNPANSGRMLILHEFMATLGVVGSATGAVGLMVTDDVDMADKLTIEKALAGSADSVAFADDGATLTDDPRLARVVGTIGEGAVSTQMQMPGLIYRPQGSIIVKPGTSLCTYTTQATTADLVFSYTWEEKKSN